LKKSSKKLLIFLGGVWVWVSGRKNLPEQNIFFDQK